MSMTNKVRVLREKQKLTQRELAEKAGTSQQQIARIEAGRQICRIDLAARISAALGAEPSTVFPQAMKALGKIKAKPGHFPRPSDLSEVAMQGIDADPHLWIAKVLLRGGQEEYLPLNVLDKNRLFGALQRTAGRRAERFFVFDSGERRVLLNLDHVIFCHILFEPPHTVFKDQPEDDGEPGICVHLAMPDVESLYFDADPDVPDDDDVGQLGHIFFMAELADSEDDQIFRFEDADGEHVFLRGDDVAMFSTSLWLLDGDTDESEV